jgi:hypothetical protein
MPIASLISLTYSIIYCTLAYIVPGYQTFKVRHARRRSRREAPLVSLRTSRRSTVNLDFNAFVHLGMSWVE